MIDIGFISALFVFNIIDQITKGQMFNERLLYTIPLVIAFAFHFLPFKHTLKSFIFLGLAILIHYDSPNPSDFSSAIFFMLAFSESKNIRTAIIVSVASLAVIVYKSSIIGDSNPQALSMATLFVYLYIRSYFSFFKDSIKPKTRMEELSKEQQDLMYLVGPKGLTQKEIALELKISHDTVYNKIKEVRSILTPEGEPVISKETAIHLLATKYEKPVRNKRLMNQHNG